MAEKKQLSQVQKERIDRLKAYRNERGWTQEKFAEMLGVSLSGYKKVESYQNRISLDMMERLHDHCGMSADYILYGSFSSQEKVWGEFLKCSETDRMMAFLRIFSYEILKGEQFFPGNADGDRRFREILQYAEGMMCQGDDGEIPPMDERA